MQRCLSLALRLFSESTAVTVNKNIRKSRVTRGWFGLRARPSVAGPTASAFEHKSTRRSFLRNYLESVEERQPFCVGDGKVRMLQRRVEVHEAALCGRRKIFQAGGRRRLGGGRQCFDELGWYARASTALVPAASLLFMLQPLFIFIRKPRQLVQPSGFQACKKQPSFLLCVPG